MKKVIIIIAIALAVSLSATAQTTKNMDRIEVCKQNYHTLFGGEALTGQGTDPEMMDILARLLQKGFITETVKNYYIRKI